MPFNDGWIAEARLRASTSANEAVLTLHYDCDDTVLGRAATIQALATRLGGDLLGPFRALFIAGWTIDPVRVVEAFDPLDPDDPREGVYSSGGGAGTRSPGTGDLLPNACNRTYTLRTSAIGRSFRGLMHVPGSTYESDQGDGLWVDPAASNFAYLANAFVAAIPMEPDLVLGESTVPVRWSVYSRTRRSRSLSPYITPITSAVGSAAVRWLRSRERGH